MNNGRFVFRVWPSKQSQASSTSGPHVPGSDSKAHSRKAHRKSRGGCLACKKRRKKCDEGRPSCSRCLDKKIDCRYIENPRNEPNSRQSQPNSQSLPTPLWPVARAPPVLTAFNHIQYTPQDLFLLNHFVQHSGSLILGPDYTKVFTVQALAIAQEVPFLMHAMLAVSACQLLHNVPEKRPYQFPEALHAQLASQGLRQAVAHMKSARDMDAAFTSAMLLNCLAFCYADWRDEQNEMQRSRPSWQWLRIQLGIKDLIIQTHPFHQDSIWMPMFVATMTFKITEPAECDLDARLAEYCGITSETTTEENAYLEFYEKLAPLVARPIRFKYLRIYSDAIGGLDNRFVELLEQEDSKAMMLFAHWLALMCSFVHWTTRRTRRECWLMCRILDQRLLGKDRLLLEKPSMACGYPLDAAGPLWPDRYVARNEAQERDYRALISSN